MFTRGHVDHQYGDPGPADYSPPPFHATMHAHQYPAHCPPMGRAAAGAQGGLEGGYVVLTGLPSVDLPAGRGFRYLGMDPSDPQTWPRPFNPAPGMIAYLNVVRQS
jgi:hypothetical protein